MQHFFVAQMSSMAYSEIEGNMDLHNETIEHLKKQFPQKPYELISSQRIDGAEMLVLYQGNRRIFSYAPSDFPSLDRWYGFSFGFLIKSFTSREACIRDAELVAGHPLEVK